jgi:Flp pilus assembly protein TadB
VPSVSRHSARLAVLAVSLSLLGGAASGCSTTQEKAERQQARATHILQARTERQRKQRVDGPQIRPYRGKSAHQQEGER